MSLESGVAEGQGCLWLRRGGHCSPPGSFLVLLGSQPNTMRLGRGVGLALSDPDLTGLGSLQPCSPAPPSSLLGFFPLRGSPHAPALVWSPGKNKITFGWNMGQSWFCPPSASFSSEESFVFLTGFGDCGPTRSSSACTVPH